MHRDTHTSKNLDGSIMYILEHMHPALHLNPLHRFVICNRCACVPSILRQRCAPPLVQSRPQEEAQAVPFSKWTHNLPSSSLMVQMSPGVHFISAA